MSDRKCITESYTGISEDFEQENETSGDKDAKFVPW